ncbi:MAG: Nucleoid-associated protein [candidate division BRC1 bacterium ADurb.BinA364]|nr:MAG: Nucleoid-associated protein [candidate division BRC1 bacterium ADurb.BinA364]
MLDLKKLQQMQRELQERMESMQENLGHERVEGVAGGGMVKVIVNGRFEVVDVQINPEAVDPDDVEMLQDLFVAAANAAIAQARELSQQNMAKIMPAGMGGLPGLPF